jgi:peptidoglycan/LPS O-acetylase OafA/YrhL
MKFHFKDNRNVLNYRPDIDGLRAIAVIFVLIVHAFPKLLPNGFVGVDIFFVISGYLISKILLNDLNLEKFSIVKFYVRRANRILPALILVTITTLLIGWLCLYANELTLLARSALAGVSFVANINLYNEGGYWDTSSKLKPLLHLWSLGVEEQFYIFWPIILWVICFYRLKITFLLILFILISFIWNLYETRIDQNAAFYLPFSRFWELLSGGLLAYFQLNPLNKTFASKLNSTKNNIYSVLGFVLILASQLQNYPQNEFPGTYVLFPVLGTVFIISAGSNSWINSKVLSNRILVYIGLISYPLYLWHWPIITFNYILQSENVSTLSNLYALLLSLILAISTYHTIEIPFRNNSISYNLKALILWLITIICGIVAYIIMIQDGFESRYNYQDTTLQKVILKQSSNNSTVAVLGDSQAEVLGSFMPLTNLKYKLFATAGWPYLLGTSFEKISNKTPTLTNTAISEILSDKNIDIVVITNMYNYYTAYNQYSNGDRFFSFPLIKNETSEEAYYAGLRRTVKLLTESGKKVLYIKSIPFLGNVPSVMACSNKQLGISRKEPKGCLTPMDEVKAFREGYDESLNLAFKHLSNIYTFETIPLLCDESYCYVKRNDIVMYRDSSHLNLNGAYLIGSEIVKEIDRIRSE